MSEKTLDDLLAEFRREYDAAPRWKRAWWWFREWAWPISWCGYTRSIQVCLPVPHVAGSMLGARRWTWLWSMRSKPFRLPVGFRVHFGGLWEWRRVWTRDDGASREEDR